MHLRQRRLLRQFKVLQHRVAQQNAFPEIADDGQVGFQAKLRYVGEDVADGGAGDGFGVEGFDELVDVLFGFKVSTQAQAHG
jgi:hypothetical protein